MNASQCENKPGQLHTHALELHGNGNGTAA